MSSSDRLDIQTVAALQIAAAAADVNNYCDHAEHLEVLEKEWVTRAGQRLRVISCLLAQVHGEDIIELYAERLAMIERKNVHFVEEQSFDGCTEALQARTWRDLQLCQTAHDRVYHPDVLGLTRYEQLRHYAFHVAKLAGSYATWALGGGSRSEEIFSRRLPDTLLFGVKLATVMSERLSEVDGPHALLLGSDEQEARALLTS